MTAEAEEVLAAYEAELAKARADAQEQLHTAAEAATAEADARNAALAEKLSGDSEAARVRINEAKQVAVGNVSDLVEDIAGQAVKRLIGVTPDSDAVRKAIDAAARERS